VLVAEIAEVKGLFVRLLQGGANRVHQLYSVEVLWLAGDGR
jgi:hypothetical protein